MSRGSRGRPDRRVALIEHALADAPIPMHHDALACPTCRDDGFLEPVDLTTSQIRSATLQLAEREPVGRRGLVCRTCARHYPITIDGIPVLWSEALADTFAALEREPVRGAALERDVKAANIHVYESIVEAYDGRGIHADGATRARFASALDLCSGWNLDLHVDVGCGGGNVLVAAREAGAPKGLGIDVSISALRRARNKGFQVVLGDAEALPLRTGSASLITASSVLHHLFDPERLIREAFRTCRGNGAFLTDFDPNRRAADLGFAALALYNARGPAYRLLAKLTPDKVGHSSRAIQRWNRIAEHHNRPGAGFDPDQLRSSLEGSGFEVRRIHAHDTRDRTVSPSGRISPRPAAAILQLLSLRNPWRRENADTLLTISEKPPV